MFKKNKSKNKTQIPGELIDRWQRIIFSNAGIDVSTDHETAKDALRKIILESSKLYCNIQRIDDGFKPLKG